MKVRSWKSESNTAAQLRIPGLISEANALSLFGVTSGEYKFVGSVFYRKTFYRTVIYEKKVGVSTEQTISSSSAVKCYSAKTYWEQNVSAPKDLGAKTSTPESRIIVLRNAIPQTKKKRFKKEIYFGDKIFYRTIFPLESIRRNEYFSNRRLTYIIVTFSLFLWICWESIVVFIVNEFTTKKLLFFLYYIINIRDKSTRASHDANAPNSGLGGIGEINRTDVVHSSN